MTLRPRSSRIRHGLILSAATLAATPVRATARCPAVELLDDPTIEPVDEVALRTHTANAVACEFEQPTRDFRRIAALTDRYFERSSTPSCQLIRLNAEAHIALAQALADKGMGDLEDRNRRWQHWRHAWDVLSGLSQAWQTTEGTNAEQSEKVVSTCIRPARDLLSKFPSVTVAVTPETLGGFQLLWDQTLRSTALPRILPGSHTLEVTPPAGYATQLSTDDQPARTYHGSFSYFLDVQWMDRTRINIRFVPNDGLTPMTDLSGEGNWHAPQHSLNLLTWLSGGAVATGLVGMAASGLLKNHFAAEAQRISDESPTAELTGCRTGDTNATCPWQGAIDNANAWGVGGVASFGVLTGLGAAGLLYSLINSAGDTVPRISTLRIGPPNRHHNLQILMSGRF